jgi:hypothetical protein
MLLKTDEHSPKNGSGIFQQPVTPGLDPGPMSES